MKVHETTHCHEEYPRLLTRADQSSTDESDMCMERVEMVIIHHLFRSAIFSVALTRLTFAEESYLMARDVEIAPFAAEKVP